LCKDAEGAVAPFQVKALKDGIDDSVDAGDIDETDHGPRAAPNLYKNPLNEIRGTKLRQSGLGKL
jgi:hypothetical protein